MPDLRCDTAEGIDGGALLRPALEAIRKHKLNNLFDIAQISLKIERLAAPPDSRKYLPTTGELLQWLDDERSQNHILAKRLDLNALTEWQKDTKGFFSHKRGKFFKIVGVRTSSPGREVPAWSQPILDNEGTGIIGLLMKKLHGVTYFLMQAKVDVGNRNIVQLGPTVQFNPGNYIDNEKLQKPFLFNEFQRTRKFITVMDTMQAEEGGRFYKEENCHRILMLPDRTELSVPPQYRWIAYAQIQFFLHLGDTVNSSARSILSCLI